MDKTEITTIEGRNPVYEALDAGLPVERIYISNRAGGSQVAKLISAAKEKGVPFKSVPPEKIDELAKTDSNQGVVAVCAEISYVQVSDILHRAEEKQEPPFVIIADEITDPHNLGAIIRTANAVGAHGVIIPKNRSAGVNPVVFKTSAGAAAHTPVARVGNLTQAMDALKKHGLWITGADMAGEQEMCQADLTGPIAIVVGSEGKGITKKIRDNCDFFVRIPMVGEINSLNASVAAAVLMYEALRQRRK
ncbi:MAG: 23S rRNA (guanosine(2251)-2'-O)-methyltransferase RlmB [Clostridia bacterium]|nr:23S rRNA (guanosine(2251)-2'-O)-methyltransferase RlmB [Clostridia bacterium]